MNLASNLQSLRTAIPYIRAYKGRTFVIKLGGELCRPGPALRNLAEQIALLHQLGIRIVVVHGGGPQASELSRRLGLAPHIVAGRRVTDAETLEVAKMAFAGTINTDVVAALCAAGAPAVGLSGVDGGMIQVRKRPVSEVVDPQSQRAQIVDFGFVGDVTAVDVRPARVLMEADYLPVVSCLAADTAGQIYNVNADTVAAHIAIEIGAAKYFLLTQVDGVLRDLNDPTTLLSYMDIAQLDELVSSGAVGGGMLPKLAACREVLGRGVPRVHIVNGIKPDTLLAEVFTNEGCGTLIVASREPVDPSVNGDADLNTTGYGKPRAVEPSLALVGGAS